jgi:gliding motility-associated-like protein
VEKSEAVEYTTSNTAGVLNNVAFADPSLYTVSYHLNNADAMGDANPIDKVNPYTNVTANRQTIHVRVEHNNNPTACVAYTTFDLIVHPLPVIAATVELKQCDDNTDGFSDFNLTEANQLISTNHTNETFTYFPTQTDAVNNSNPIVNPIVFRNRTTPRDIVWARATNSNGCYRIAQVDLVVSTTGIPATFSRTFNTCDDFLPTDGVTGANDDTDGVSLFDFSSVDTDVRALFPPTQQLTITYYRNSADALAEQNAITDIANYRNIGYPNSQQIYIRVDSQLDNGCLGFGPYITLNVDPVPTAQAIPDYELCDDLNDGDGTNGIIQSFDLESRSAAILGTQNPANYTVTYHLNANDANTGANALASPYTNAVRDRQTIYVRVTGSSANCFTDHTSFDLVVNPLPIANFVNDLEVCDDNTDGSARNGFSQNIDLEMQTAGILGTQDPAQFSVTYHIDLANAQAGTNPLGSPFSNSTAYRQTIFVRVYNSATQCANGISNFDVVINPEPIFTPVSNLSYCDDDDDGDDTNGFIQTIDLDQQIVPLLDQVTTGQDPDDFNVTFHESQADATSGMSPITSPFSNTFAGLQTIHVRIENKRTGCVNDDASFDVIVNPLPDFQVTTPQIVCLNGPVLTISVENPADIYDYVWTDPNNNTSIGSFLNVTSGGLYSVTATTTDGTGCSRTRTIQVNESIIATITQDDVTIVDDSDNNSITIDPTNLGVGDYEYALTDENNVMIRNYQDSPLFERLEGGFYNILVRDKNGCGEVSLLVSVVEFPKFFTPNNDGVNDTWVVKGANSTFFPTSSIYIFNRFGKVVANIPIDSQGWNGTYGGNSLPSDDYWFAIKLVDPNGEIRERKGNFSLLRK